MKIEDVDPLFTALSEEFGVPKPNYCIFQVSALKKLDPLFSDAKSGLMLSMNGGGSWATLPMGANFRSEGKYCYITLLVRKKGQVLRKSIVHEFFHYLHWVQGTYKISKRLRIKSFTEFCWNLLNEKPNDYTLEEVTQYLAERHEEERITKGETRKWLREHPAHTRGMSNEA